MEADISAEDPMITFFLVCAFVAGSLIGWFVRDYWFYIDGDCANPDHDDEDYE